MNIPSNPATWLKIAGAVSTGVGSILLAWRVKEILKWVVYCLLAHEQFITQLRLLASSKPQTGNIVEGVTEHLLNVESKLGIVLLVLGFLLLGVDMLCNATTYFSATCKAHAPEHRR
jgi:hypothetical protein